MNDGSRRRVRRFLLGILLLGMLGSAAELLLLAHYEDAQQIIPLALFGIAPAALAWHAAAGGSASLRLLQLVMLLFIAAGLLGIVLHFRSSMEFQLESNPDLERGKLFWKVMQAKAPPTLAPGIMVQLGLLGLVYASLRPAHGGRADGTTTNGV